MLFGFEVGNIAFELELGTKFSISGPCGLWVQPIHPVGGGVAVGIPYSIGTVGREPAT